MYLISVLKFLYNFPIFYVKSLVHAVIVLHDLTSLLLLYFIFIGRAGASPPSRTATIIFLYIYIYIYQFVRRALNLLHVRASFSPIFQYFYTRFFFSDNSIFPNLYG